jgi:hypothetical protein
VCKDFLSVARSFSTFIVPVGSAGAIITCQTPRSGVKIMGSDRIGPKVAPEGNRSF